MADFLSATWDQFCLDLEIPEHEEDDDTEPPPEVGPEEGSSQVDARPQPSSTGGMEEEKVEMEDGDEEKAEEEETSHSRGASEEGSGEGGAETGPRINLVSFRVDGTFFTDVPEFPDHSGKKGWCTVCGWKSKNSDPYTRTKKGRHHFVVAHRGFRFVCRKGCPRTFRCYTLRLGHEARHN